MKNMEENTYSNSEMPNELFESILFGSLEEDNSYDCVNDECDNLQNVIVQNHQNIGGGDI